MWRENKYFKYNGTWVLYILGAIGIIGILPGAITSLMQFTESGLDFDLFLTVSSWGFILSMVIAVYVGVRWIIHKDGAKYSLISGFLLALLTLQILMAIIGIGNSVLLQP